jgi:hypothetical protein
MNMLEKNITPCCLCVFTISHISVEIKDKFHTRVAKHLYFAKRVRPDILVANVFLTTRVLRPNEEDLSKLNRVIRDLRKTKHLGL